MLKKIFAVLAVLIAVFAAVVATRPADFRVERSIVVNTPPATVFTEVNEARRWEAWSPWEKIDPNMKKSYEGPPAGAGSVSAWSGNMEVGAGRSTIVESRPNELVRFKLEMAKPMKAANDVLFTFAPEGNGTRVTWSMEGKNNFMSKAFCLFMDMDKMVGGQFEKGLTQLKAVAESAGKGGN